MAPRPLPAQTFRVHLVAAADDSNDLFYTYEGFLNPDTLYHSADGGRGAVAMKSLPEFFDADGMTVEQYEARSKDGTMIPYFIFMPRGYTANGANPTLLKLFKRFMVPYMDSAPKFRLLMTVMIIALLICFSFPMFQWVKFRMLPKANVKTFLVTIDMPASSSLNNTDSLARALEDRFRRRGLPYQVVGGVKFYERREIQDVLGYLRLISNPRDEDAFLRVVNYPRRGIGGTSVQRFMDAYRRSGLPLLEAAASGVPIVATEDGGPRDIIGNCHNGQLVDPLDTEDIARALLQIIDDKEAWRRDAQAGLEIAAAVHGDAVRGSRHTLPARAALPDRYRDGAG